MEVKVRELKSCELPEAMELVYSVFLQFEAPLFGEAGVVEFKRRLHDKAYLASIRSFGAFLGEELVGVMATQNGGTHIALYFVNGKYHRQGIGRELFEKVKSACPSDTLTVNASPYAVPIYHKYGFVDTDVEQIERGIRFTPMVLKL